MKTTVKEARLYTGREKVTKPCNPLASIRSKQARLGTGGPTTRTSSVSPGLGENIRSGRQSACSCLYPLSHSQTHTHFPSCQHTIVGKEEGRSGLLQSHLTVHLCESNWTEKSGRLSVCLCRSTRSRATVEKGTLVRKRKKKHFKEHLDYHNVTARMFPFLERSPPYIPKYYTILKGGWSSMSPECSFACSRKSTNQNASCPNLVSKATLR